jgi:hypothetical protein
MNLGFGLPNNSVRALEGRASGKTGEDGSVARGYEAPCFAVERREARVNRSGGIGSSGVCACSSLDCRCVFFDSFYLNAHSRRFPAERSLVCRFNSVTCTAQQPAASLQ